MPEKKTVIVGNGCAAMECIKAMREQHYHEEIHLFSNAQWPAYNPMLTTYYAAGKIDFDTFFPYGSDMSFYMRHRVQLHMGSPVTKVDAVARTVENAAGTEIHYDQCLIASGARPFVPPVKGLPNKKVLTMRTIEDAQRLKKALQDNHIRKGLVIGASVVGVKVAEVLYEAGVSVCLADQADSILPMAAHPGCAEVIKERLMEKGFRFRLGDFIEKAEETSAGFQVCFKGSDRAEQADLIILCTGTRANIEFLNKGQVELDQGVIVDQYMQSNRPGLFAAGDVAQGNNLLTGGKQIIGLWANARVQGRTAGLNMAGVKTEYSGTIPHNIAHFMGMVFTGIGDVRHGTREEIHFDGRKYIHLVWQEDQLTGVNLLDEDSEAGVYKYAVLRELLHKQKNKYGNVMDFIYRLTID